MAPEKKDKKRKASAIEPAVKKSKENKTATEPTAAETVPAATPKSDVPAASKFTARKRAADFLDEDTTSAKVEELIAEAADAVKPKKKKSKKASSKIDPIDAPVVEQEEAKVTTVKEGVKKSKKTTKIKDATLEPPKSIVETVTEVAPVSKKSKIQAKEAAPKVNGTVKASKSQAKTIEQPDLEIEEEPSDEEDEDQTRALLTGFDDDEPDTAEDKGLDPDASMPGLNKKAKRKLQGLNKKSSNEGPGTVYVGRIPHGFYEHQMRAYFSQFGDITNLRLSRNRKTGASKHFAFIEFATAEVAKIVADTMDNYLMFGHILKCKFVPQDNLHPDTWKGANRRYKATPWNKLEKQNLEQPKSKEKWEQKLVREQKKREIKQQKMKGLGYDFQAPNLKSVNDIERSEAPKAIEAPSSTVEETTDEPTKAIEAPPQTQKSKTSQKKSKAKESDKLIEQQINTDLAAAAADAASELQPPASTTPVKATTKSKKSKKSKSTKA